MTTHFQHLSLGMHEGTGYNKGMNGEEITIDCDLCGTSHPYHALGNFGWGNVLMCETCAQAQAEEWDHYAAQKDSMDA